MSSDTLSGSYFPSYNSISTPQDFSWSWTTSSLTATGARVVTDLEYDSPSDVPKTSLQPLTTIYNPPASCATFTSILTYRIPFPTENGAKNPPTNEFSQTPMYRYPMTGGKEQSCLPLSDQTLYSPGLYCPSGRIAHHHTTEYAPEGNIRIPETQIGCCYPGMDFDGRRCYRNITTPASVLLYWTHTTANLGATTGLITYGTYTYSSTILVTPKPSVPLQHEMPPVVLRYRQTDVPVSFSATDGALSQPYNTTMGFDNLLSLSATSTSQAGRELRIALILICVLAFIMGVMLFVGRLVHRRRQRKAASQSRGWYLGVGVYTASAIATMTGGFLLAYTSRKDWQEETIRYFESPNSVRLCVQIMAFILRTCSTLLAWTAVAGIGWLSLAGARGMQMGELLSTLDMTVTGGTYKTTFSVLWEHLKSFSVIQAGMLFIGLCLAFASDLVGISIVASTGLAQTTVGSLQNTSVPFILVNRTTVRGEPLPALDPESLAYSSTQRYPVILKQNNTVAFLPLTAEGSVQAPADYLGVARFGEFRSECRPVEITGHIDIDMKSTRILFAGNIARNPFDQMESLVESQFLYTTEEGEGWYDSGLPGSKAIDYYTKYSDSKWRYEPVNKEMRNLFDPRYEDGRSALAAFRLVRNETRADSESSLQYFMLMELAITRTIGYNHTGNLAIDGINSYAAGDIRKPVDSGRLPVSWDSSDYYSPEGYPIEEYEQHNTRDEILWKTRVCEIRLPRSIGILNTGQRAISPSTTPFSNTCGSTSVNCPNVTYYSADFSTYAWSEEEAARILNSERLTSTENSFWNKILGVFTSSWGITGEMLNGVELRCPGINQTRPTNNTEKVQQQWIHRAKESLGCTVLSGAQSPKTVSLKEGLVFCHVCSAKKRASSILSTFMIHAMQQNDIDGLSDAFGTVIMHLLAGTYNMHLPLMNGVGPAVYSSYRFVTLITAPYLVYLGVAYTMFLIVITCIVQARVRAVLGMNRSGNLLATAAVVHGSPLGPLLERDQMLVRGAAGDAESLLDENKDRKMRLGMTDSGKLMVGYADEVERPRHRSVRKGMYQSVRPVAPDSPS